MSHVVTVEQRTFRQPEDFDDNGMMELFWRVVELLEQRFKTETTDTTQMSAVLSGGELGDATLALDHEPLPSDRVKVRLVGGSRPFSQVIDMQELVVFIEPRSSSFSRFADKIVAAVAR